ncbi:unnamed protein product [Rotaria sp. Silwood1]|nr:unnamed protein product [Rotaria sp. Silwood1]CAF0959968.1 unnamed protein product [Rotaria sp. Silwood1]
MSRAYYGDKKQQHNKYSYLLVDIKRQNSNVALVQLNLPKTFNCLSNGLIKELATLLEPLDNDDKIACIFLTDGTRAFASGTDIKEMQNNTITQIIHSDFSEKLSAVSKIKKPIIAAVNGLALGGSCELSMLYNNLNNTFFYLIFKGANATQRLSRYVGKSKAMEIILKGNRISTQEAEQIGLVNTVFPADKLVEEAIKTAEYIASYSKIVAQLAKESINRAFETTLTESNQFERFKNLRYRTIFGLLSILFYFLYSDCSIQTDQFVIEDEQQHHQTIIHFNNLIIDVNKGTEVASPSTNINTTRDGQIYRTFKFPFLRLPIITDNKPYDLNNITCAKCQSPLKIIAENQTFKIVQQQNANADDINEIMYCHRFCEAHQHEHKHHHQYQLPVPLDLHSELIILETIECLTIGKEYSSSDLIHNELVQCSHCSSCLGSFGMLNSAFSLLETSI